MNTLSALSRKTLIRKTCLILAVVLLGGLVGSCQLVHKAETTQGNIIPNENLDQIKVGMSAEQVRYLMGTPVLSDALHTERMEYVYYRKPGYGPKKEERLVVFLQNNKVTEFRFEPIA